jgi:hypothetical protein
MCLNFCRAISKPDIYKVCSSPHEACGGYLWLWSLAQIINESEANAVVFTRLADQTALESDENRISSPAAAKKGVASRKGCPANTVAKVSGTGAPY